MSSRTTPVTAIATILALWLPATLVAAPGSTIAIPALEVTFGAAHDARVESANPATNYGSVTPLRIRGGTTVNSYLKFTVSGLAGPIDSARVRLFCDDASVDGGRIHAVANDYIATTTPWIESGLTWTNAPALSGPILDQNGDVLANTWVEFDVTPAITGDGTYSFGLASSSTNIAGFRSKEGVNPPELVIFVRVPPVIASFTPASGAIGAEVVVGGTGFHGATSVAFNGVPAAFVVDSDVQLRATVPPGAKTGPISVTNPSGTGISASDFELVPGVPEFSFTPAHDARVESANPAINYGSNTLLRVRGGTAIHSFLKFNVTGLASSVVSAKLRLFCTDESADGGRVHAVAHNYVGTSTPWVEGGLVWNNAPALDGVALDQAGAVILNTWVEFDVTPAIGGNGTYSFGLASSLANIAGYSSKEGAKPPQLVIQLRPPAIAGFTPITAPVGAEVTVTGTDLAGVTAVEFNTVAAAFTIDSDIQLRATVPMGASSGPIRVTSPGGTAASAASFIVIQPPTINGFSPATGFAGSEVTIDGTAFNTVTGVEFYGTAASFVIDNDTRLRATVPAGAQSGRIHVTSPAGTATSSGSFAVQVPPAIVGGLWTSAAELALKPMSGPAWAHVLAAADTADLGIATVSDQNSAHNISILAAGIAFARTGNTYYRDVVARACDSLVAGGRPTGRSLPWARETGAYVLAADLVGYRTNPFEFWLRNMAEIWEAEEDRHLLEAFWERPNNWGANAFGTIAAIYGYLGDTARLGQIRDYWIQAVTGPNPGQFYDDDRSWHADSTQLRAINPPGTTINGFNVDGVIPDDMQRGGPFKEPPQVTNYPWEHLQGLIMAARVLERRGLPIWREGDDAIYRAAYALQVRLETAYGGWKATADDLWMLPFLDAAYGTHWSASVSDPRLWQAGKNTGWAYVVWEPTLLDVGRTLGTPTIELGPMVPSPVRETGRIEFRLSEAEDVDLRVVDVAGRVVRVLAAGRYAAGAHRVEFQARGLASGMYVVRLAAGGTTRGAKVVVIR